MQCDIMEVFQRLLPIALLLVYQWLICNSHVEYLKSHCCTFHCSFGGQIACLLLLLFFNHLCSSVDNLAYYGLPLNGCYARGIYISNFKDHLIASSLLLLGASQGRLLLVLVYLSTLGVLSVSSSMRFYIQFCVCILFQYGLIMITQRSPSKNFILRFVSLFSHRESLWVQLAKLGCLYRYKSHCLDLLRSPPVKNLSLINRQRFLLIAFAGTTTTGNIYIRNPVRRTLIANISTSTCFVSIFLSWCYHIGEYLQILRLFKWSCFGIPIV